MADGGMLLVTSYAGLCAYIMIEDLYLSNNCSLLSGCILKEIVANSFGLDFANADRGVWAMQSDIEGVYKQRSALIRTSSNLLILAFALLASGFLKRMSFLSCT